MITIIIIINLLLPTPVQEILVDKAKQDQVGKCAFCKLSQKVRSHKDGLIAQEWSWKAHQSSNIKRGHWSHQTSAEIPAIAQVYKLRQVS